MLDARKISSTNGLERLNRESRRRSAVVGVLPSEESYVRLAVTLLMEDAEGWSTSHFYLSPVSLAEFLAQFRLAA